MKIPLFGKFVISGLTLKVKLSVPGYLTPWWDFKIGQKECTILENSLRLDCKWIRGQSEISSSHGENYSGLWWKYKNWKGKKHQPVFKMVKDWWFKKWEFFRNSSSAWKERPKIIDWKFRNMSQTFYANIIISFLLELQKQLNKIQNRQTSTILSTMTREESCRSASGRKGWSSFGVHLQATHYKRSVTVSPKMNTVCKFKRLESSFVSFLFLVLLSSSIGTRSSKIIYRGRWRYNANYNTMHNFLKHLLNLHKQFHNLYLNRKRRRKKRKEKRKFEF